MLQVSSDNVDCNSRRYWWEKLLRFDFHNWILTDQSPPPHTVDGKLVRNKREQAFWEDERTGKSGKIYTCQRCGAKKRGPAFP